MKGIKEQQLEIFSTQTCQLVKTPQGKMLKVPYILTATHSYEWSVKINDQFPIIHADREKKYRLPKIFPMQFSNTETTQKTLFDSQHLSELNGSKLGIWRRG